MSKNFHQEFHAYILSRIESSVEEHKSNHPSYRSMKEKHDNLYELTDEIIEGLPLSDREIMMEYFDLDFTIQAEEDMTLYYQGMKDCVGILKELGVL